MHLFVNLLDLIKVLRASRVQSLLKGHLDVKKVSLQLRNEFYQLGFLARVVVKVICTFIRSAHIENVFPDVLFHFLVGFNLPNRLPLSVTLCLLHLVVTEAEFVLLILLLELDGLLEVANEFFYIRITVTEHIPVLSKARDHLIVLVRLATVLEQVLCVVNVGLLKSFKQLLLLDISRLVISFHICAFKLCPVVSVGLLPLSLLNQLIVKILKVFEVGDDATLVLFITRLFEVIVLDLEHFEIVALLVQVPDRLLQVGDRVRAN